MDYKLFYASESAAQGIRVMLEELGVHYELIAVSYTHLTLPTNREV